MEHLQPLVEQYGQICVSYCNDRVISKWLSRKTFNGIPKSQHLQEVAAECLRFRAMNPDFWGFPKQ